MSDPRAVSGFSAAGDLEVHRRWLDRRELWRRLFDPLDLAGKAVLDAGTGEGHFTLFLAERSPARLVSISDNPDHLTEARARLGSLAPRVQFERGDATNMTAIPDASFDVVAADFLIAAVAGLYPYRETDTVKELHRVTRPGGRLILTGWEVAPGPMTRAARIMRELARLREAAHLLADHVSFREHPCHWVAARLTELGSPPERIETIPDVHRDFHWFIRQTEAALSDVEPAYLKTALSRRLRELADELDADASLAAGVTFGQLYGVVACKLANATILLSP